jgi:hypothetical protein
MFFSIVSGFDAKDTREPLTYAESDAVAMHSFLGSGIGPGALGESRLLVGPSASKPKFWGAFTSARLSRAQYLVVYFSGHGNDDGILLSDGFLHFADLIDMIKCTEIERVMVVLDTCGAGGYVSHMKQASLEGYGALLSYGWMELLARATPGTRLLLSTGAGRSSIESAEVSGGHFTQTLLYVLNKHFGDLRWGDRAWISDQLAFGGTYKLMRRRFGDDQLPVALGVTGDFPMAVSQVGAPVGEAEFGFARLDLHHRRATMELTFRLYQRKNVDTVLLQEVVNLQGEVLFSERCSVVPTDDSTTFEGRLVFPIHVLRQDSISRLQHYAQGRARFDWKLSLMDSHGQLIDRKVVDAYWYALVP